MNLPEKSLQILHIPEPELEFGHRQFCDHPKDGLFLYGPHEGQPTTQRISVGVIGTEQGIEHFRTWATKAVTLIPIPERGPRDKEHRLHVSDFPGLEEA